MRKVLEIGGLVAGLTLIVFGVVVGVALRNPENTLNSIFGRRAPKTVGSTPLPTA